MPDYLSIGDFSRATHMTVKTLRHYHQVGLLEPAEVDPGTGYRRYSAGQIPVAQVITRLRELDMPLAEIHGVLSAPDLQARNERIAAHLNRLEEQLGRTRSAVASLRDLVTAPQPGDIPARIELHATLTAQDVPAGGPAGGIFADEVFTRQRGQVTIFVPCTGPVRPMGRVAPGLIPAVELAVIERAGPPADVDRTYGTLAAYVARHALTVDSPIREYYLVGQRDTPDSAQWRTEIGWPIFRTLPATVCEPAPET